jgi:rare lipoprotein A
MTTETRHRHHRPAFFSNPQRRILTGCRGAAAIILLLLSWETGAEAGDKPFVQTGKASWYGEKFRGKRTASGEAFDPDDLTGAHRTLPFGAKVRVTNRDNGKSVIIRIIDRGPQSRRRILDVSKEAARRLGIVETGIAPVRIRRLP